jgi:hypothetical protein
MIIAHQETGPRPAVDSRGSLLARCVEDEIHHLATCKYSAAGLNPGFGLAGDGGFDFGIFEKG